MSETYKKQIIQHIIRNLLDIQLLRIIQTQPTWGYKIKKTSRNRFQRKTKTRRTLPHAKRVGTERFRGKQKTAKRWPSTKSLHHNRERENLPTNILQHSEEPTEKPIDKN